MSTSNSIWNIYAGLPLAPTTSGMAETFIADETRSLPNNRAGYRVQDKDRHTNPYPSYLYTEDGGRMEPLFPVTGDQLSWLVDKEGINIGMVQTLTLPSTRLGQVTQDGIPTGTSMKDPGLYSMDALTDDPFSASEGAQFSENQDGRMDPRIQRNMAPSERARRRAEADGVKRAEEAIAKRQKTEAAAAGAPAAGAPPVQSELAQLDKTQQDMQSITDSTKTSALPLYKADGSEVSQETKDEANRLDIQAGALKQASNNMKESERLILNVKDSIMGLVTAGGWVPALKDYLNYDDETKKRVIASMRSHVEGVGVDTIYDQEIAYSGKGLDKVISVLDVNTEGKVIISAYDSKENQEDDDADIEYILADATKMIEDVVKGKKILKSNNVFHDEMKKYRSMKSDEQASVRRAFPRTFYYESKGMTENDRKAFEKKNENRYKQSDLDLISTEYNDVIKRGKGVERKLTTDQKKILMWATKGSKPSASEARLMHIAVGNDIQNFKRNLNEANQDPVFMRRLKIYYLHRLHTMEQQASVVAQTKPV